MDVLKEKQCFLFDLTPYEKRRQTAYEGRTDARFLRNEFPGVGKYGIPLVRKQAVELQDVGLIACTNTVANERENFDLGVHFFVDDTKFESVYANPEKTFPIYSQYRFCCTPDFSLYGEMAPWRQIESVARNRWCGAWWQSKGMLVIPTISWDRYPSYEYCFDGVESGSTVAVTTYACRQNRAGFLRGYEEMLKRLVPTAVLCYGDPFPEMRGPVVSVPILHPRQFHREKVKNTGADVPSWVQNLNIQRAQHAEKSGAYGKILI